MIDTLEFYTELINKKVDLFAGVPDSLLAHLCACIKENTPQDKNIITANEGNAVAICAGYHLATGNIGVVYMQNSGEGNAVNPLVSLADEDVYSIPMLLIVGWRGEPGKHDEPQHIKQGQITLSMLDTMGIKYSVLNDEWKEQVDFAIQYMRTESKPYALIVKKDIFSPYKINIASNNYILKREDALEIIIDSLSDNDIIVSTTGKTSREIFEIREKRNEGHANDFLTVGSMGHTASLAYGVCLGTEQNVYCIDGDGSFIMHMGNMAVIGSKMRPNFKYILNDNGAHESVGGQPTCSPYIDIPHLLKGFGFQKIIVAETEEEIRNGMQELKCSSATALVLHTRQGSRNDLGRPTTTPQQNKIMFMTKLGAIR